MGKSWRLYLVYTLICVGLVGLIWRLLELNSFDRVFLLKQSQARILRTVNIPAYRGMIMDTLGDPLAISIGVQSVWVNPDYFNPSHAELVALAKLLNLSVGYIHHQTHQAENRGFVYLRRRLSVAEAAAIKALDIPGVFFQREFRRYYPEGEVTAHIVGFTNVDDQGQEGMELAYNRWLSGMNGSKQVIKDRLGNVIAELATIRAPVQGKNIQLSIDHRIQYLAHRRLAEAVKTYHATSGSVVVMDVETGEVLAMVNQPSYDPNNRAHTLVSRYRNRAATDMFEPGSVIKPFTIALALASGKYSPDTKIDTHHGWMSIGGYRIRDDLDYGVVTLTELLQHSSNIAAAKVLLSLPPRDYWQLLQALGFGERTTVDFPGEASGHLIPKTSWVPSVLATLAYGYGLSVTPLQLAHAYSIIASGGISHPVSLLKVDPQKVTSTRVLDQKVAREVIAMLKTVIAKGGTGTRATVPDYQVAGKTGTAYMAGPKGYDHHHYMSSFVGMAPARKPKLVVVVVIKDPQEQHMGGIVAAPVFSQVMEGALRLLNIPSDRV